jgi:hypothetical protein
MLPQVVLSDVRASPPDLSAGARALAHGASGLWRLRGQAATTPASTQPSHRGGAVSVPERLAIRFRAGQELQERLNPVPGASGLV